MRSTIVLLVTFCAAALSLTGAGFAAPAASTTAARFGWKLEYDDGDRVSKVTDPAGRDTRLQYSFDTAKRLRKLVRTSGDGANVSHEFDELGQLSRMHDGAGTVSYSYDAWQRLNRVQRQGTPAIAYTYDTLDRLTRLQVGDFYQVEYRYDFLGRLESMMTPAGVVRYEYLTGQGQLVRTLPNGVKTMWEYEPNGELHRLTHVDARNVVLTEYTYQYRPDGLIEAIQERSSAGQFVKTYEYDVMGRLVYANGPPGQQYSYEYDLVGNRVKAVSAGKPPQTYAYDWAGRLAALDGHRSEHDAAGNLTSMTVEGTTLKYRHNQDGQLAEVLDGKAAYRYDGEGRLIARKAGGVETTVISDPLARIWRPLVMENAGSRRMLLVWEDATPLVLIRDGKPEYLLHDHLGSVRLVADAQGKVTRRIDYEPFGIIADSAMVTDFAPRFAGLFWDPETQVYVTLARSYSPGYGRWLQSDPIKLIPSVDQKNLSTYTYCGSNPVNLVDLDGQACQPCGTGGAHRDDPMSPRERWQDFTQALTTGRLFGTRYGEEATEYWAKRWAETGNPLFAVPGAFSALWTSQTAGDTFLTLTPAGWLRTAKVPATGFAMLLRSRSPQELFKRVSRFFFDPRTYPTIQRDYARVYKSLHGTIEGFSLHHWLFPQKWKWVPQGIRNAGFNLLELPDFKGIFHSTLGLNQWMGWAQKWGPHAKETALAVERGIRVLIPTAVAGAAVVGGHLGDRIRDGVSTVGGVYLGGAGLALEGLGLLDGLALDRNNNLVLLGRGGEEVKLPPLRLDDVVTVFRSVYLHGEGPTVTIDPNPENPEGSAMIVRHGKATESTYVGWVLYHADRLMKGYTLGVDNITQQQVVSAVPDYPKVLDTMYFGGESPEKLRKAGHWERFWIVPAEARRFGTPRNALTLFDVPLKVKTQSMKWQNRELVDDPRGKSSPGALAFTKWFTEHYDLVAHERFLTPPPESGITSPVPVFTELRRIALITAIAEKLRNDGVPLPFWMREYEVRAVPFEQYTPGLEVSRSNQRIVARIYGGVGLSAADKDVRNFTPSADLSKLAKPEAASVREKLALAGSLEEAVRMEMAAAEPLTVRTFAHKGTSYQSVALPGAETLALAPARLEDVDLAVPVEGGDPIQLVRSYHSFFAPRGPWGKGWALDLPRLEQIPVPVRRDDKGVVYEHAYELVTPLNSLHVRFSRVENVSALKGSRLQVPDQPCDFFGMTDARPAFLSGPTTKLIRKDGGAWHFSKAGDLVAIEQNGSQVVYERDEKGRLSRIVGLLGGRLVAFIELRYDGAGRIESAKASDTKQEAAVHYEYDDTGRLIGVVSESGRLGYRYEGSWVAGVTYRAAGSDRKKGEEKLLRSFQYGPRGQLLAEIDSKGAKTEYRVTSDAGGSAMTVVYPGSTSQSDFIRYDQVLRPVEARDAEGIRASWNYPDAGGVMMDLTEPDGRKIRLTESPDRRSRTLQFDQNRKLTAEYDVASRLTSVTDTGRTRLRQEWSPDGRLLVASNESSAAHLEYSPDGFVSQVLLALPGERGQFKRWQTTKLDPAGRPREITDYQGLHLLVEYSSSGELTAMVTKRDGKNYGFQITRDESGRIQEVRSSWGKQHYLYDTGGLLTKLEVEKAERKGLAEWKSGLLQKVQQFDGGEFFLAYHEGGKHTGLPKGITTPNGLRLAYEYDGSNRLSQVAVGSVYRLVLGYDSKGRLTGWHYLSQ